MRLVFLYFIARVFNGSLLLFGYFTKTRHVSAKKNYKTKSTDLRCGKYRFPSNWHSNSDCHIIDGFKKTPEKHPVF